MNYKYCSIKCLHKHRNGILEFQKATQNRKETEKYKKGNLNNDKNNNSTLWSNQI